MTSPASRQGIGDFVLIGGVRSPGLVKIEGALSPRKWEELQGPGFSGAYVWYRGIQPAHFSLKFSLFGPKYTSGDWEAWHEFHNAVLARPPLGPGKWLDIWHPDLEPLGIQCVGIEGVGAAVQGELGEWTIEVKLIEYIVPKKIENAKPEGSKSTPVDPYDQQIDRLTDRLQLERLAGR